MILVSKSIYSSRRIRCYIYKNLNIIQSHKHVPFFTKRTKIGSIMARDMILVPKSIFTRTKEFNDASIQILISRNHTTTIYD